VKPLELPELQIQIVPNEQENLDKKRKEAYIINEEVLKNLKKRKKTNRIIN
jgi:hypothetical protein